ncbi:MAG TPA: hypothetical protein VG871_15820 [Vicinamibacterales bacterium]|nr:hypothetical protein [Vicinamibacterales bacterium]
MSRLLLACVIAAALAATTHLSAAQTPAPHPDFTGIWRVDRVDTNGATAANRGVRRGGFGGGGFGGRFGRGARRGGVGVGRQGADATGIGLRQGEVLEIRQTADHLILTTHSDDSDAQMISYALDGKDTNNKLSDTLTIKTKAKWNGATLVTDTEQTFSSGRGNVTRKVHEVLTLADPDTLTVQAASDTAFGRQTSTASLTRVSQ